MWDSGSEKEMLVLAFTVGEVTFNSAVKVNVQTDTFSPQQCQITQYFRFPVALLKPGPDIHSCEYNLLLRCDPADRLQIQSCVDRSGFPWGAARVFLQSSEAPQSGLFGCFKPSCPTIEFASVIALVSISSCPNFSPITFCLLGSLPFFTLLCFQWESPTSSTDSSTKLGPVNVWLYLLFLIGF